MNKNVEIEFARARAYAITLYASELRALGLKDSQRELAIMCLALAYSSGRHEMLRELQEALS